MKSHRPSFIRVLYHLVTSSRSAGLERQKPGSMRPLAIFASVALVGVGALILLQAVLTPWACSLTGGPVLIGEWYGELRTPTGGRQVVFMMIERPSYGCENCPDITGTAQSCDGRGSLQKYEIWGDPEDWRGTRFRVKTRKVEDRPLELRLGDINGEWDENTLLLTTTLRSDTYHYSIRTERDEAGKETTTMVGAHPDTVTSVTFTLGRGGEPDFLAACRRLETRSTLTNCLGDSERMASVLLDK